MVGPPERLPLKMGQISNAYTNETAEYQHLCQHGLKPNQGYSSRQSLYRKGFDWGSASETTFIDCPFRLAAVRTEA